MRLIEPHSVSAKKLGNGVVSVPSIADADWARIRGSRSGSNVHQLCMLTTIYKLNIGCHFRTALVATGRAIQSEI